MTEREIDALIAEKVFDWAGLYRMNNVHGVAGWPDINRKSYLAPEVVPAYSTNPAASDQLLDKMLALGWDYRVRQLSGYDPWVSLSRRGANGFQEGNAIEGTGKTRQMAVAIASLAALRVKVPV